MNHISSLALSYGGVALTIGAGYAHLAHGDVVLPIVLAMLALVLIGIRIGLNETISTPNLSDLRRLAPRPRSLAVTLAALLLVSAAAGGGMLGPDAQQLNDHASPVGEAEAIACGGVCIGAGVGIAVGFGAGYVADKYLAGDDTSDVYAEADNTETHIATSTHVDTIAVDQDTLHTVMQNQVNDGSRSVAWSKAKAAAVKAMNNGSTEAETRAAAKQAVTDYYVTMEMNAFRSMNKSVQRANYLDGVYRSGPGGEFLFVTESTGTGNSWYMDGLETGTYTLLNGTDVTAAFLTSTEPGPGSDRTVYNHIGRNTTVPPNNGIHNSGAAIRANYEANVTPSRTNEPGASAVVFDNRDSQDTFADIASAHTSMRDNAELWVNNTYSGYTAGDIDETEILDPVTLSQEFATSYNDTGYYGYAAADLALQGTNGTLEHSMVFDLHNGSAGRTENVTLNGTLFTDWEPASTNGTWETGTTYNASDTSSLVYVATNDGLAVVDGEFHITSMTNVDTGEAVNSTTTQNYNRQTAEAGWNQSQYEQLLQLQQELDETQAAAAGGGSGLDTTVLFALIAAAGAALMMNRRD